MTHIIEVRNFIRAIRDSGYRGTGFALAELLDNSFEADAKTVQIELIAGDSGKTTESIAVLDDGHGMSKAELRQALQFGGSSRFNQRRGTGRFGMGLPNSSVSQSRRLEVFTWRKPGVVWCSYLDVDEIVSKGSVEVPTPQLGTLPKQFQLNVTESGTLVLLRRCDRLSLKRISSLQRLLQGELGRIFRMKLWEGKKITLNGVQILPVDPLFLRKGLGLKGAKSFGPLLEYQIGVPGSKSGDCSLVKVRFSELPVSEWASLSNQEKRRQGISNGAAVSVIRAGREIDRRWIFFGRKRKENYDDWWRTEVEFEPVLDELFGVTHTKQGINPSPELQKILAPDLESIALKLNRRVREKFAAIRVDPLKASEARAIKCESLFPPLCASSSAVKKVNTAKSEATSVYEVNSEFDCRVCVQELRGREIFHCEMSQTSLKVTLNKQHPLVEQFYLPLADSQSAQEQMATCGCELIFIAAARAQATVSSKTEVKAVNEFIRQWSDLMGAYFA